MNDDRFEMTRNWQTIAVAATIAIVVLLIISNVLLLRIVNNNENGQAGTGKGQTERAALPELPAPSSSGTSRALLKELDRTKKQLKTPLKEALGQLEMMSSSTATLDQLPALLQSLVASMSEFSEAAPELHTVAKQLKSMNKRFKKTSDLAEGLGPVLVDLAKTMRQIEADTARIRACAEKPSLCP